MKHIHSYRKSTSEARPKYTMRPLEVLMTLLLLLASGVTLTGCLGDEQDNYLYITSISNTGYLAADGEQLSISVYTNVDLTVTASATWLYVVSTSSDSDGNDYYAFTIEPNTSTSRRSATITFSGEDLVASFTVTQYAAGESDDEDEE